MLTLSGLRSLRDLMKSTGYSSGAGILSILLSLATTAFSADVRLELQGTQARVSWPSSMNVPGHGIVWPEYRVSHSTDLVNWKQLGGRLRGVSGRTGPMFTATFSRQPKAGFFRVESDTNPASASVGVLGEGGGAVFGYSDRFADEINRIGLMTLDEFAASVPSPEYLPQLSFDPTIAAYWEYFNTNASFRLNAAELEKFKTNGFVVSERLGHPSFGGIYHEVFHGDMPVFISTDSILQAWHRTYLNMMEELEEVQMATLLGMVLDGMLTAVPGVWSEHQDGPLRKSIEDADFFLTVARSLLRGGIGAPSISTPEQQARVSAMLAAIESLQLVQMEVFGTPRWVDCSQFIPRGHYTNSERLKCYFRAMIWLGRTDFRVATFAPNVADDIRELGTAIVLRELLNNSFQFGNWLALEQFTRAFVGVSDSMTLDQLSALLDEAEVWALDFIPDLVTVSNLQTRLLTGSLAAQSITGDFFYSPLSPEELRLPRSCTFLGQKFVLDSWAFSHVVFDKIHWPPYDVGPYCGATNVYGKVVRRKPSCLDIAYTVFGNDQVVPNLVERMTNPAGVPFRDGLPYQHNLFAVHNVISNQTPAAWNQNIYTAWLAALRALSEPTTGSQYPEAMRTRAWAMKTLNTQLASWTELRHDTVLYAKQSYTPPLICSYPYGFVEPRVEFWQKMKALAEIAANAVERLYFPLPIVMVPSRPSDLPHYPVPGEVIRCDIAKIQQQQVAALRNFGATMATLEAIARKELNQEPLTVAQELFLIGTMEYLGICHAGEIGYTGWYPALFYPNVFWQPMDVDDNNDGFHNRQGCAMPDQLVADVHTDLPDDLVCDPGAVIHEGVGNAHLLMIAIDNGPDRMVYAGPVFSHYEFEMPAVQRLTDLEWKAKLSSPTTKPPSPDWTRSFLVPKDIVP